MKIVLLSGISGSGKSTYAARLVSSPLLPRFRAPPIIFSADDFFVGLDGEYRYQPGLLGQAHGTCFRNFVEAILEARNQALVDNLARIPSMLILDNTNTTAIEMAPYAALAQAYDVPLEIHTLHVDIEKAVARQIHSVPRHAIEAQARALSSRVLPPFWVARMMNVEC